MPTVITEASTFDTPLNTNADGDPVNAANMLANCNQGLANRTLNLADRTGGAGGTGEFLYDDGARSRILVLAGVRFQLVGTGAPDWDDLGGGIARSNANGGIATLDLSRILPHGAVLTRVKAIVTPGIARATVGNRMSLQLDSRTPDFSTPAGGGTAAEFTLVRDDGTANIQVLDSTAFTMTVDSIKLHYLTIAAGNDGATNTDLFYAVQLSFDDIGPINI